MEEQLIEFSTAKLAKEKGFNIETLHFYTKPRSKMFGIDEHGRSYSAHNTPKKLYTIGEDATLNIESVYPAPTQSLLQKWIREVHKKDITVITDWIQGQRFYYVGLSFINSENKIDIWFSKELSGMRKKYETYEEALEIGLQEALKLVKN